MHNRHCMTRIGCADVAALLSRLAQLPHLVCSALGLKFLSTACSVYSSDRDRREPTGRPFLCRAIASDSSATPPQSSSPR